MCPELGIVQPVALQHESQLHYLLTFITCFSRQVKNCHEIRFYLRHGHYVVFFVTFLPIELDCNNFCFFPPVLTKSFQRDFLIEEIPWAP